jgi:hypothetical protein
MNVAYCDYIAHTIVQPALKAATDKGGIGMIQSVSYVKMDLAEEGYMQSTKRTISVTDINGKEYIVTIEEV